jgi:FixJ family two-component response regulator
MSGYTDDALAPHLIRDGSVAFLPKPFTPAQLALTVSEVLGSHPAVPAA